MYTRAQKESGNEFIYQRLCDKHIVTGWVEVLAFDMKLWILLLKNTHILFEGFFIAARVAAKNDKSVFI